MCFTRYNHENSVICLTYCIDNYFITIVGLYDLSERYCSSGIVSCLHFASHPSLSASLSDYMLFSDMIEHSTCDAVQYMCVCVDNKESSSVYILSFFSRRVSSLLLYIHVSNVRDTFFKLSEI